MKEHGEASYIFDCAGNEQSIKMSIDLIRRGGTILLEGIMKGTMAFPMFMMNNKEITLTGCLGHDRDDIAAAIHLFDQGHVDPDHFITDIIGLHDLDAAFKRYMEPGERHFIKTVVKIFDFE